MAWILGIRRIASKVINRCTLCRRLRARLGEQIMGDSKVQHLTQAPPFTFVDLDLAGPFSCKAMVKSRTMMKVWALAGLFVCRGTGGAVHIYLCPGYDTRAFLIALEKFVAHCGNLKEITSDRGSQPRSADNLIDANKVHSPENWEWDYVSSAAGPFSPPAPSGGTGQRPQSKYLVKHTLSLTIGFNKSLTSPN